MRRPLLSSLYVILYFIFFQVAYFWFEVICAVLEEWLCANVTPECIRGWDFETADVYGRKCSV